ncbi:MAG: TIGR03936 family radical SAM-associated protein [Ilumatobacteraceae bacterium]
MRLRLRSTKLGKVRFVGHRDMARLWDRTLRRLGAPVAFTRGFTPRPRIAFGLALPMGAESLAEYIDIELDGGIGIDVGGLPDELSALLPDGVDVTAAALVDPAADSLQAVVTACTWELWSDELTAGRLDDAIGLLDHDELLVERERKRERRVDDIRPLLLDLRTTGERLVAELATTGRALRPSELSGLAFPDIDPLDVRVLRINQWTSHDGARREVLTPRALPVAAHHREVGA